MSLVYLNGQYLDRSEAKLNILDRGFIFGDGVYEVIPVYQQKIFHGEDHLARLDKSLAGIRLPIALSHDDWKAIFARLLAPLALGDYSIYLQVTRGSAPERDHLFPVPAIEPTIYVQVTPFKHVSAEKLAQGLQTITVEDVRWQHCYIKAITLLPNLLARQTAQEQGADEAILLRGEQLTEGSMSNVFIVKDGIIKTPAARGQILVGITRQVILMLLKQHHLPYEETEITRHELETADEIWISNSSKEVAPVTILNHQPVGDGKIGKMWQQVYTYFQQHKKIR